MQAQLFGLLDLAQDAHTRTASTVDAEKRRLLKALDAKTERDCRPTSGIGRPRSSWRTWRPTGPRLARR